MASESKGYIRVPVWVDDGVVKPLVNDDGRVPVLLDLSSVTLDVNLESSDITLPVTESSPLSSIQSQLYGWDLNNWRKNPIVWGYTSRWRDVLSYTVLSDTFFGRTSGAISSSYIAVLDVASITNETGARGLAYIAIRVSDIDYYIAYSAGLAAWEPLVFRGPLVLRQGDFIRFYMGTCLTDDVIRTIAWGYLIKINE